MTKASGKMGQHLSGASGVFGQAVSNFVNNLTLNANAYTPTTTNSNNNNNIRPYDAGKRRQSRKKAAMQRDLTPCELNQLTEFVLSLIRDWFPDLQEKTYYLPAVHMNKIQHRIAQVGGTEVKEIQKTPESDWRDDEVMQRTLFCLRALTDTIKEPMVVLLQVQHDNYLHKPCYAAAAKMYPRPCDLPTNLKRGDFDILFLHKHYGIIVAEIKSVGWRPGQTQDDETVLKKMRQAIDQLNKADTVLQHLVSDLKPSPRVTKTLILPNVSTARMTLLLQRDPQLAKDFCRCFKVDDLTDAVMLCLCSQQMTSLNRPADVTASILKELEGWWQRLVVSGGYEGEVINDPELIADVYELIVARFCGPASTVQVYCNQAPRLEVRTLGDAVQVVGERMIQFVLFPEQLAILQEEDPCVYLTGPPGTGKTLLLILVGLKWAREGKHVHIISTGTFSEAATQLLVYQVQKTLEKPYPEAVGRIHVHLNGNSEKPLRTILEKLISFASTGSASEPRNNGFGDDVQNRCNNISGENEENGNSFTTSQSNFLHMEQQQQETRELYVVADEVGEKFLQFFQELKNNVSNLHIWAASYRQEHRPADMTERVVSACLRSPPVVQRRMQTAISFAEDANGVHRYEDKREDYLAPSDGPPEIFLSHLDHQNYLTTPAMDCVNCGHDIADLLLGELCIGRLQTTETGVPLPAPLKFQDVFVIPDYYQDPAQGIYRESSGLVRGLEERGVPVFVVHKQDSDAIRELARASRDAVSVLEWGVGNGLERKVVVSVGQGRKMGDKISGVLHGSSRCVSQLIYVECPETYVVEP